MVIIEEYWRTFHRDLCKPNGAKFIAEIKARGIAWFACATTLAEARATEAAGADAIVAQGSEAGGRRGAFDAAAAERQSIGLSALVPRLADKLSAPIIATGGNEALIRDLASGVF